MKIIVFITDNLSDYALKFFSKIMSLIKTTGQMKFAPNFC